MFTEHLSQRQYIDIIRTHNSNLCKITRASAMCTLIEQEATGIDIAAFCTAYWLIWTHTVAPRQEFCIVILRCWRITINLQSYMGVDYPCYSVKTYFSMKTTKFMKQKQFKSRIVRWCFGLKNRMHFFRQKKKWFANKGNGKKMYFYMQINRKS